MSYCFKKRSVYLVLIISFTSTSFSQQGIAPNGCYPSSYQGSIFTGEVIDGPLDVLILKDKEIFTGRFDTPCQVPTKDGKMGKMLPSDIPLGSKVTVFYYGNASKPVADVRLAVRQSGFWRDWWAFWLQVQCCR